MKSEKKISPKLNKHFIVARTRIDISDVGNLNVDFKGYQLMYSRTGLLDNYNLKDNLETLQLGKKGAVTFYWFPKEYNLAVPWGFKLDKDGSPKVKVNGVVKFSIDEGNIKKLIQLPVWEMAREDGYTMEYLSDYFIDDNGNQNGLSIWFRNELLPVIKDIVEKDGIDCLNNEKLTEAVKNIRMGTDYSLLNYGEFKDITDLNIIKPSQEFDNISES